MLQIHVADKERFDEEHEEFIYIKGQNIVLEHSLISLSKWESKWCKPFLGQEAKTNEEIIDYIRCMTLTQNVDPLVFYSLDPKTINEINEYINAPMTATWFSEESNKKGSKEVVTSEVIYYWMIALNIPFQCEKWHLNRLLTLIKVCNEKNKPAKKMNKKALMERNRSLNEARKAALNSKG